MMRRLLASALLLAPPAAAANDPSAFSYAQRLGSHLPLQTQFRDSDGRSVRLDTLARATPLVLALGYFHCTTLCGVVREDVLRAVNDAALLPGRDYTLAVLSIDPSETSADAAVAKAQDVAALAAPGAAAGWHYLTGSASAIAAMATAVGFRDRLDATTRQFLHPAGVVIATAGGIVSAYLVGVGYTPTDMRAAVVRAGAGGIAAVASPVLLLCFHFDAATGRYTLAVEKLLRLAAALTVLIVGGGLLMAFRGRTRLRQVDVSGGDAEAATD